MTFPYVAPPPNPCFFTGNPLDRASERRSDKAWLRAMAQDPSSMMLPLYRGDPLIVDGKLGFLSIAARSEFPRKAPLVLLGLKDGRAYYDIDAGSAERPELAPFADIGAYLPLRETAGVFAREGDNADLAIVGQARWLVDWHLRHEFCAKCGGPSELAEGGAKRICLDCEAEHFPRSDPVAIVLAIHEDACLLGRSPHFPPGMYSALAGFVEAAETPEECAIRELREEAGVTVADVAYQFSQPWPFPSSLMMGFFARAEDRNLTLDETEISEAIWATKKEVRALVDGHTRDDLIIPPRFTIARQLIDRWATTDD